MTVIGDFWEVLVLIAFIGTVITVFGWSYVILVRIVTSRGPKKDELKLSKIDRIVLTIGAIGLLCVLYGLLVEPFWLEVVHVKLETAKIPKGQSIRLVHISDLHCDPDKRLEDKLPVAIAEQHPDAILFTGDAINSPAGLKNFRECLKKIAVIAPTFVVKGNWDAWYFKDQDRFGGTGATELTSQAIPLRVRGSTIWIGGVPVGVAQNINVKVVMARAPLTDYRIFLFHYPDCIEEMQANKIDLYLAGHTHGGQVALPFYGALVTLAATGKKYESGLHRLGDTFIYSNRGIGMEGGRAPRVRFCARPEVTVIDVNGVGPAAVGESKHCL